jgi:hypothetical protein
MLEWMDSLSAVRLAVYCSAILVGITWFGIIFFKPFIRWWLRKQPGCNELVSYTSAGFSLFYGLLLGLLSVAAYQNAADVQRNVDNEASSLALVYRGVASYPEPLRSEVQFLLRDYTQYVINKDWPAHEHGKIWNGGALRLQAIEQNLMSFEPTDRGQQLAQEETLNDFNDLIQFRQQRLTGVRTSIPGVLWYVVAIGAAINIIFIWLLDMRFTIHMILGGIVSFFLGVMIFLIAAIDHPMRGAVRVSPDAYQVIYDLVMQWDETT